ncbi:hypothetical protein HK102_005436 [Quaeritorhiza haematococci]|nr:hypothetical protein HK102_005436 [Quaeritorhiza haematococci]
MPNQTTYSPEDVLVGHQLIPHIQALLQYTSLTSTEGFSDLLESTFEFTYFIGNYNTAKTLMERYRSSTRNDIGRALALHNMGRVAEAQGDYVTAERLLTESLRIRDNVYGTREHPEVVHGTREHPSIATTLHNLGNVAISQGNYVKAEQLYMDALSIVEKLRGTRGTLVLEGDYVMAEQLLSEVLRIYEKVYGTQEHPSVALTFHCLGVVARSQKDYVKAEQLTEALSIREKVYGTGEHPEIATTLSQLGNVAWSQGDYVKAEKRLIEVLRIYDKVYGTREHPYVLITLEKLSKVKEKLR